MDTRILLIIFLLNSFGETFRYPPIHQGWTNAGRTLLPKAIPKVGLQSGDPPVVDPIISREKALKLIGLLTKILGDLSALHKKQGTYVQLGYLFDGNRDVYSFLSFLQEMRKVMTMKLSKLSKELIKS